MEKKSKKRFNSYFQLVLTERDKQILEEAAERRQTTASELIRQFIRTLDNS